MRWVVSGLGEADKEGLRADAVKAVDDAWGAGVAQD